MGFFKFITNPIVIKIGKILLGDLIELIGADNVPKIKRKAFEKMTESMQEFSEFILEQKQKVEATETELDNIAYNASKKAFRHFLDQGEELYKRM